MHLLIIGGTRFVGYLLAWRMIARGHKVTLLNRGSAPDPFENRVERLHLDRTTPAFAQALQNRPFDAVVDFAAFTADDVRAAIDTFSNNIGHYLYISTGQVYLVRENCPKPAREEHYDGPVMPNPGPDSPDLKDWLYGIHKRAGEDLLAAAWASHRFPATRVRIPMVNGPRDYYRRIEGYLWRLLDGGPLLLPDVGPQPCRHVYGHDVVNFLERILHNPAAFGRGINLCQQEQPPLADLLHLLAGLVGAKLHLLPVPLSRLAQAGLPLKAVSPFSDTWMSRLDPALAVREFAFAHTPLEHYLHAIVASFLAHPPADRPPGYLNRPAELALAAAFTEHPRH